MVMTSLMRPGFSPRRRRKPDLLLRRLSFGFGFLALGAGFALELALDHLALERAHVVDEQLVDEVVVFVLHGARVEVGALSDEGLAVEVDRAHPRRERALDRHVHTGE